MALATGAAVQTSEFASKPDEWCRRLASGKERVWGLEWKGRGTAGYFILLRRSRCGEVTSQVSGKPLLNRWVSLMARNISSLVIDWLCCQVHDRDIAVAGLYCDYLAQGQQSATNMLGAILKQLLERDGIPDSLRQAFRKEKRGFGGLAERLLDMVKILKTTIASLPEVFICIDGLDECLPKNRRELLESLQEIAQASPTTRVFLSGKPYIRDEIGRYFAEAVMIAIIPTIRDIERCLENRLDRDPTPSAMDDNLRAEIMRVIPRRISQICVETTALTDPGLFRYPLTIEHRYLLVSLNIDAVLEEVTIYERKKRLDEMIQGNGLRSAYSATLTRIQAQKGSRSGLGMEMLMWLSHSERPLNANEVCHALGVEIGSTDSNYQNIPTIETLLGHSLGPVTVEASSYTVRLVHYTLRDYLFNNNDLFHNPHSMIAEVCLTYLNFQSIRDLPPILGRFTLTPPLLEYASCYWGAHAKRELTESANTLALRLLDGFDEHVSSGMLLSHCHDNWDRELCWSNSVGFTGLHGIAYLGIVKTAVAVLELKKWDLGATDVVGNTAVAWAARKGHGAIVKILLEREGITPDTADKYGRTPLSWAAGLGHGGIVKTLLEREDVTPNAADKDGRTPLSRAAEAGFGGTVNMLLEREDVAPDTADKDDRTPLSWGAGRRHEDIVMTLLEQEEVTPDSAGKDGRTPLSWAAETGHGGIVKMLLERENVNPDTTDKNSRTPLSWATRKGCGNIVRVLLEREDVAPDTADKDGRTPLSWAVGLGHGDIVKMLLKREDVTPNIVDRDGRTPLLWAAENRRGDIVKMLLEREDLTPNTASKDGRTPLLWAVERGRGDIVKMLLGREDVAPNTAGKDGRTPLSLAAGGGRGDIVKTLFEREDLTPNTMDKGGRTPLSWAADNGYEGVVKMLLEREDITPDTADGDGRTALSWATERGHIRVEEMLLERCSAGQGIVMTGLTGQMTLIQTTEKQHGGVLKRRLGDRGSIPQSGGSNRSIDLFPPEPSESLQRPSKRVRRS